MQTRSALRDAVQSALGLTEYLKAREQFDRAGMDVVPEDPRKAFRYCVTVDFTESECYVCPTVILAPDGLTSQKGEPTWSLFHCSRRHLDNVLPQAILLSALHLNAFAL